MRLSILILSVFLIICDAHGEVLKEAYFENTHGRLCHGQIQISSGDIETIIAPDEFRIFDFTFISNANHLLVMCVGGIPGVSGHVGIWSISNRDSNQPVSLLTTKEIDDDCLYKMVSPSPGSLFAGGESGILYQIQIAANVELTVRQVYEAEGVIYSIAQAAEKLAIGDRAGVITLFALENVQENKSLNPIRITDHSSPVSALCFSADATTIYSGSYDGKVRMHTSTGRLLRTYKGLGIPKKSISEQLKHSIIHDIRMIPDKNDEKNEVVFISTSCGGIIRLASANSNWELVDRAMPRRPVWTFSINESTNGIRIPECTKKSDSN